jgi:hypothetical protein
VQVLDEAFARDEYQNGLIQVIHLMADSFAQAMPRTSPQRLNTVPDAPIVL